MTPRARLRIAIHALEAIRDFAVGGSMAPVPSLVEVARMADAYAEDLLAEEWVDSRAREVHLRGHVRRRDIPSHFKAYVEARDQGFCGICGGKLGLEHHFDHEVPLAQGGPNDADNLQLAHPVCNVEKGDRLQ